MVIASSWEALTVNELRRVLLEAGVDCPTSVYKRKSQLVDLCVASLGTHERLREALQRFRKLEETIMTTTHETPARPRRSTRRPSSTFPDIPSNHIDAMQDETPNNPVFTPARGRVRARTPPATTPTASESLAASQAARRAFQDTQLRKEASPTVRQRSRRPVVRCATPEPSPRPVVRAGRFSIPSDDIILSPTRHIVGSASRETDAARRTVVPSSASRHEGQRTSKERSLSAGRHLSYNWPAVDPEGNPIRWKIRDPFVFSVAPSSHAAIGPVQGAASPVPRKSIANAEPGSSTVSSRGKIHVSKHICQTSHYKRRCLAWTFLISLILLIGYPKREFVITGWMKARHSWNRFRHFLTPVPYCDTKDSDNVLSPCLPCPDNAICANGQFTCKRPQYRKQKHRGEWMCVKNQEVYRHAHHLVETMSTYLSRTQGDVLCGDAVPSDAVLVPKEEAQKVFGNAGLQKPLPSRPPQHDRWIGYTQGALEKRLDSTSHGVWSLGTIERRSLYDLLFDEVLPPFLQDVHYPIAAGNIHLVNNTLITGKISSVVPVYLTRNPQKRFKCVAKEWAYNHGIKVPLCIAVLFIVLRTYKLWARQRALRSAIRRIITENTSIQHLGDGKGYAIGPRASDIHHVLTYGTAPQLSTMALKSISYPEYPTGRLTASATEHHIQLLCEDLVKQDPHFCRSVLYVDRIPFYFNKRVIDRTRLETAQQHQTHVPSIPI